MATGILKYKQDDGSIVELIPAGFVTQTTYNAGQAAQDGRLDALESLKHTESIIRVDWVPVTRGEIAMERYFVSPVPLTKTSQEGYYTLDDRSGNALVYYIDAGQNINHGIAHVGSMEVLNTYTARINFDDDPDNILGNTIVGLRMQGVSPSISLKKA